MISLFVRTFHRRTPGCRKPSTHHANSRVESDEIGEAGRWEQAFVSFRAAARSRDLDCGLVFAMSPGWNFQHVGPEHFVVVGWW